MSTEDGLADTLKPRLDAAGADCTKIHVLTGWRGAEDDVHHFTLQHMPVLEAAITMYQPALVVLDPIQAYLGDIDMHRANETRPLLAALTRLAERYRCAIVCVRHPAKPGQGLGKAIHRGLGSIDFIGAARTGLFIEQHPADPAKVLMGQSKSNIGPLGRTQVFSKHQGEFRWEKVSRLSAEIIGGSGRGPDPLAFLEAVIWLEDILAHSIPHQQDKLRSQAEDEGIALRTLQRAKKALGVRSIKGDDGWVWQLPLLLIINPPLVTTSPEKPDSLDSLGALGTLGALGAVQENHILAHDSPQEDHVCQESHESQERQERQVAYGDLSEINHQFLSPLLGEPTRPDSLGDEPPITPCWSCRQSNWWLNPGRRWVCGTCHPPAVMNGHNGDGGRSLQ